MNKTNEKFITVLPIFAIIAILVYVVTRSVLFIFAEYSLLEKLFAVLLIVAEFFVIIHGLGYVFNIIKSRKARPLDFYSHLPKTEEPSVAILVAARHEPKEVLRDTFLTINAINYKNKRVYFLDDSSLDKYKRDAEV